MADEIIAKINSKVFNEDGTIVIDTQPEGSMFGILEVPRGFKLTKKGTIIHRGASGSWKESRVEGPQVFWDVKIGKWRMVYLGYSGALATPNQASIGFATADSPNGPWTEYVSNPVLAPSGTSGSPDQNGCSAPHVWFENGTYYLFYLGLTATGLEQGNKSICLATSTDFLTWTRHGAVILPAASTWRASAVWHPNIVKRGGLYYMFFNANVGNESIGYATSTDLSTWTVDDVNSPVLSKSGSTSNWDGNRVGDPYVWRKGDIWYMSFYGAGTTGDQSQEGMAWTTDALFPLSWTKFTGNPTIPNSAGDDAHDAGRGSVLVTGGRLFHWYTTGTTSSVSTSVVEIALAVDDTLNSAPVGIQSIQPGSGIAVDNTDPANPVVSSTGGTAPTFVGCRAYNNVSQSIPNNVSTALTFNTEDYDTSAIHDTTTNPSRFTVPTGLGGRWRISFHTYSTGSGTKIAFLRKNGGSDSNNVIGGAVGNGFSGITVFTNTVTIPLVAGDYLELFVFQNSGAALAFGEATGSNQGYVSFVEMQFVG